MWVPGLGLMPSDCGTITQRWRVKVFISTRHTDKCARAYRVLHSASHRCTVSFLGKLKDPIWVIAALKDE